MKNDYRSNKYKNKNENKNENKSDSRDETYNRNRNDNRDKNDTRSSGIKKPVANEYSAHEHAVHEEDIDEGRLEGRNPVMEALKSGRTIDKILVSKGEREGSIRKILALAKEREIIVQEVDRSKLDSISTTHSHQGVIAYAAAKEYVEVDDILEIAAQRNEPPFIIILDELTDAHNLGSILRTADSAGAHGIIIPKRRAVGLSPAVSKASAGAIEYVPVARVGNIARTIDELKEKGIWVVGTDASGEKAYYENDLKGPIALVIGSEGEGIGRLVREKCDFIVNIPMKGNVSSLNAAVAGAIVIYEVLKQRSI